MGFHLKWVLRAGAMMSIVAGFFFIAEPAHAFSFDSDTCTIVLHESNDWLMGVDNDFSEATSTNSLIAIGNRDSELPYTLDFNDYLGSPYPKYVRINSYGDSGYTDFQYRLGSFTLNGVNDCSGFDLEASSLEANTGFFNMSPAFGAVTASNVVAFSASFRNTFPALDIGWDLCFDAYPMTDGNQSPNLVTRCEPLLTSGIQSFSTTTTVSYGMTNLIWYALETSTGQKRFASSYLINVGGYSNPVDFLTMLPTTESEASSTATSSLSRFYSFFQTALYKFPFSWVIDIFTILSTFSDVESAEFTPIALNFEDMDLQIWEQYPGATSTLHAMGESANIELFSTSTLQDVADIPAIALMRTLVGYLLWVGFAFFTLKETTALFDDVDKN